MDEGAVARTVEYYSAGEDRWMDEGAVARTVEYYSAGEGALWSQFAEEEDPALPFSSSSCPCGS